MKAPQIPLGKAGWLSHDEWRETSYAERLIRAGQEIDATRLAMDKANRVEAITSALMFRHLAERVGRLEEAMARYEGSAADRKADAKNAKKAGMSLKAWEKSPADRKKDAAGQRALNKKGRR